MEVKQIYDIVNSITSEELGLESILKEDLSNIVDVGVQIFDNTSVDNYVKSLVNHIGRVIFVNRPYTGSVPSVPTPFAIFFSDSGAALPARTAA